MTSPIELIAKSLRVYRANTATLIGYSSWLLLPVATFVLLDFLPLTPFVQFLALILLAVELFLSFWVAIILVLLSNLYLKGEKPEHKKFSQKAKTLIAPVITVALLQLLITIGGLILLIVPAFLFIVWFSLSQFIVILDEKRGFDALQTSKSMVKGKFWKIVYLFFGGSVVIFFVYSICLSIIISVITAIQGVGLIDMLAGPIPLWMQILESVGEVVILPLVVVYLTAVYLEVKNNQLKHSMTP